jgi:putative ABC transport system ATP-binding protein
VSTSPVLEFTAVTKIYGQGEGETTPLREVDFALDAGECVGIMDPSGSGKTTMLTIAGALQHPTSGVVTVLGQQIQALKRKEQAQVRRDRIGFIFQSFNLLAALTALDNVEYALQTAGRGGRQGTKQARELLNLVGLGHRSSALPKDLSGGEQQRVCIARAIANNAQLILAYEPTASLDAQRADDIAGLLRAIARDFGSGVLLVAHDLRAEPALDRVLWLEGGTLGQRPLTVLGVAADSPPVAHSQA